MNRLTADDIEQTLHLFNVVFNKSVKSPGALFVVPMFGVRIVYDVSYMEPEDGWWNVIVAKETPFEEFKHDLLISMIKGGYFHYLRYNYPNTFKKMLVFHNYDKLLIDERLARFGDKSKYNYLRELNKENRGLSPTAVMSTDPGFYDFL